MNGYGNGRRPLAPLSVRGGFAPAGIGGTPPPPAVVKKLNPQGRDPVLAPWEEGSQSKLHNFDATRFVEAGGNLYSQTLHPAIIPFEELFRRLPEEGMFSLTVSPDNPFTFELGAIQVPEKMALLIYDLRPDIYRFSGIDPGDYMPVEARRFGSIMGFDVTIDQQRQGEVAFEIDPVPIQRTSQQAFPNQNSFLPQANASQQAVAAFSSFANPAGAGNALLPQRPTRFGALNIPFTLWANSGQTVQVRCVIFRPMPSPIAFIEYDIAGILVPQYWMENMREVIKPPQRAAQEGIR